MLLDAQRPAIVQATAKGPFRSERRRRPRADGTKPIDLAYLARFTLGDAALEREVLDLFVAHTPGYVARLRDAATSKAWHDAAHTLKGAARGVGSWRLARCAEAAERLCFDTDSDRRAFALDSAAEALDEALGFIFALSQQR